MKAGIMTLPQPANIKRSFPQGERPQSYSPQNKPSSVRDAEDRLSKLKTDIDNISFDLDNRKERDYVSSEKFVKWQASAKAARYHKTCEVEYLKDYLREEGVLSHLVLLPKYIAEEEKINGEKILSPIIDGFIATLGYVSNADLSGKTVDELHDHFRYLMSVKIKIERKLNEFYLLKDKHRISGYSAAPYRIKLVGLLREVGADTALTRAQMRVLTHRLNFEAYQEIAEMTVYLIKLVEEKRPQMKLNAPQRQRIQEIKKALGSRTKKNQ